MALVPTDMVPTSAAVIVLHVATTQSILFVKCVWEFYVQHDQTRKMLNIHARKIFLSITD